MTHVVKSLLCLVLIAGLIVVPGWAKSAVPTETIASIEDLKAEAEGKLAQIEDLIKNKEFDDAEAKLIQWSGMLAVVGQAIAEHPKNKEVKVQGPALRNAAIEAQQASDVAEFQDALAAMKAAYAGLAEGGYDVEHSWGELIGMYEMMEEMNDRQAAVQRSVRRPKGTREERLNAVALSLLTLAMHDDENYVFDDEDIATWKQMSTDYLDLTKELATLIDKKDRNGMKKNLLQGKQICTECHEAYRD